MEIDVNGIKQCPGTLGSAAAMLGARGGAIGGRATTPSKTQAARENGKLGGRPAVRYRIEGVITTRWYPSRLAAIDAYNNSPKCRKLAWAACPGDVNGDAFDGGTGIGNANAVHGVRDGHATITLRIKRG